MFPVVACDCANAATAKVKASTTRTQSRIEADNFVDMVFLSLEKNSGVIGSFLSNLLRKYGRQIA
jgi:phosphoribosyl 1,2-cyclic phosphodiesterase